MQNRDIVTRAHAIMVSDAALLNNGGPSFWLNWGESDSIRKITQLSKKTRISERRIKKGSSNIDHVFIEYNYYIKRLRDENPNDQKMILEVQSLFMSIMLYAVQFYDI